MSQTTTPAVRHGLDGPADQIDLIGDAYDLAVLTSSPAPFHHTATSLMLKPWPASRFSNGCLQLAERLVHDHAIDPDDVQRVVLHLPDAYLMPHQSDPSPEDYWQAIYSVQWATAMVLLGVPPGPDWFTSAQLGNPEARRLAASVHLVEDTQASARFASRSWLDLPVAIDLHTRAGVFSDRIVHRDVLGTPQTPMSPARFEGKFTRLALPTLGHTRTGTALAALTRLLEADDVRRVTDELVAGTR